MKRLLPILLLLLTLTVGLTGLAHAQTGSGIFGNVGVHPGGHVGVYNTLTAVTGYVVTPRNLPASNISWQPGSSHNGASNGSHVDGYAETTGNTAFTFPIGNGTTLRTAGISAPTSGTFSAAYFLSNPSSGTLPTGAPFSTASMGSGVTGVSPVEYWDINGPSAVQLTLSWDPASNLNTLAGGTLSNLGIVGWDGSKWVNLGGTATGTLSGTGTITTTTAVVPGNYTAYTFGSVSNCATPTVGGQISYGGNLPLCSQSNVGSLTLTGQTGAVTNWETSTNGGTTWTALPGTAGQTAYNFVNAQNGQQYRAIVNNGSGCLSATATAVTLSTSNTACTAPALACDSRTGSLSINIANQTTGSNITAQVVAVDLGGIIRAFSAAGGNTVSGLPVADYQVYHIQYDNTQTPVPAISVGTAVSAVGGSCVRWSNALAFRVCPALPTVAISGPAPGVIVTVTNPPITGTATPGASVTVLGPNGQVCSTTATAGGSYSCTSLTFANGPASVTAIACTGGGCASATTSFSVTAGDTDGDGIADSVDLDDDNDGILDINEGCSVLTFEYSGTFGTLPNERSFAGNPNFRDLQQSVTGYVNMANPVNEPAPVNDAAAEYIVTNALGVSNIHAAYPNAFRPQTGHTTGAADDAFLAVNGATTEGVFFRQSVTLLPNTQYEFGVWAKNAVVNTAGVADQPNMGVRIKTTGGTVVAQSATGTLAPSTSWSLARGTFTTSGVTSYTVEMYNISLAAGGNDFYVDDVFLNPIDPLAVCQRDSDNDGIPDAKDLDSDGDGIPDNIEAQGTTSYTAPTGSVGPNGVLLVYGTGISPANSDGDTTPDYLDTDADGDGVSDTQEAGITLVNADADRDGLDDNTKTDKNPSLFGPIGANIPNNGVLAYYPSTNGTQVDWRIADTDGDGIANADDLDDDNDGILDINEGCSVLTFEYSGTFGTLPNERSFTGNPNFRDLQQSVTGYVNMANPVNEPAPVNDAAAEYIVTNALGVPNIHAAYPNAFRPQTGHTTGAADDAFLAVNGATTEGVFFRQSVTLLPNTQYEFGVWAKNAVVNTAGVADQPNMGVRIKTTGGTVVAQSATGALAPSTSWSLAQGFFNTSGVTSYTVEMYNISLAAGGNDFYVDDVFLNPIDPSALCQRDTDSDGLPDARDLDADGDGIPDNIEAQGTSSYTAPTGSVGPNGVLLVYGTGITPVNTDGDSNPDYLDTDADGDGISDTQEAAITLLNTDADGDGLDDNTKSDKDPAAYGPAGANLPDNGVLAYYPNIGSQVTWRALPVPPVVRPDIANTNVDTPVSGNVLTNDRDPQGGPLTASLTTLPTVGTVTMASDGSYTYTPPTGFTGTTSFCYTASNTSGLSNSACVTVNVNPAPSAVANNRPIANNDNTQTTAGTSVTVAVLANDTDPDSATSLAGQLNPPTILSPPAQGTAVVNGNGTITYTPPTGFTGVVSFPYQVCDKATPTLCSTAVVSVNVQPTPPTGTTLPPTAVDDALLTNRNTPKTGTVAANDSDPAGLPLTFTSGQPTNGTVTMTSTGSYTYTPAPGYVGPDSFTYSVCNSAGKCSIATTSVNVQAPANQPPVVIPIPVVTDPGKPVVVCMPIIDSPGDIHTASVCNQPASGSLSASVNNTTHQVCLTYTPTTTFSGPLTACLSICDAAGTCTTLVVPITVIPVSPTAVTPQPPVVVVVPVITPKEIPVVVCMDIKDPNTTDTHSVSVCGTPARGSVTTSINNVTHQVCLTYTPQSGSVGQDQICLTVCDQGGLCTTVTVPVLIVDPTPPGPTPKPPVVTPIPIVTIDKPVTVCTGITDNAGDTHTASLCGQPSSGTASVMVDNSSHQVCVVYVPGSVPVNTSVCITVCDQGSLCTNVIIPITVLPANQPPLVTPDFNNVLVGIPATGNVLTNDRDPEGQPLTVSVIGTPPPGLVLSPNGSYTYTAPVGTTAPVTVPVQVCDNATPPACATTTLTLVPVPPTAPGVNLPPIANPDSPRTTAGVSVTTNVLGNDRDPEGLPLGNPVIVSGPANGTAVVNPDGTVSYTPTPGFTGTDKLTYRVCDTGTPPACSTAIMTIAVDPTVPAGVTNTAPVAIDDAALTTRNTPVTGTVAGNDRDPQGQPLTFTRLSGPTNGTVVFSSTGSYTYTPAPGFIGSDGFVYQVCDNASPVLCSTATAHLTVTNPGLLTVGTALLNVRVLLQGALLGVNSGTLMRDDLRTGGYLPLTTPYSVAVSSRFGQTGGGGGETTTPAVLSANAGTANAIVDWVLVELRNPANPTQIIATRSGLVQRDGDVVLPTDGTSPLTFTGLTGTQYFVSVKHRNHLGVMTATALPLSATGTLVDFTTMTDGQVYDKPVSGTISYNGAEMVTVNGKRALWAGDANHDGKVKYIGGATDNAQILNDVITFQGANPNPAYNYDFAFGYFFGDLNLNGKAKYQGSVNDPTVIFDNVIVAYLLNTGQLYNYDFMEEQLP